MRARTRRERGENVYTEMAEKDIQAGVSMPVRPHSCYFEERIEIIQTATYAAHQYDAATAAADTLEPRYTRVVWLPPASFQSYTVRRGDALWEDEMVSSPAPTSALAGADMPPVVTSFAGHSAILPEGYLMQWIPESMGHVGGAKSLAHGRRIVRADTLETVDADTANAVIRAAFTTRNRRFRFAGFAQTGFVVPFGDNRTSDPNGITTLIGGAFVRVNDSGETLLRGMLVCLVRPGEGFDFPLYRSPMKRLPDPRARLAVYNPSNVAAHAFCGRGMLRLLRDTEYGIPTAAVYIGGGDAVAMEAAATIPPGTAAPSALTSAEIDALHATPAKRRDEARGMSVQDAYALRLVHAFEAVGMWAVQQHIEYARARENALAIGDTMTYSLSPGMVYTESVGGNDVHTRLLRLALSQVLADGVPDVTKNNAKIHTGAPADASRTNDVETTDGAYWGMRTAMRELFRSMEQTDLASMGGDGTSGAIGRVVDAAEDGQPVRLVMFS